MANQLPTKIDSVSSVLRRFLNDCEQNDMAFSSFVSILNAYLVAFNYISTIRSAHTTKETI